MMCGRSRLLVLISALKAAACVACWAGIVCGAEPSATNVPLKTIYNSEHTLSDVLEPGDRGLVLYFMHDTCPVAQLYVPRLKELHETYAQQGVRFVGIYANRGDHTFSMAAHAQQRDIPFLVLYDKRQSLLDVLVVERTCTAMVLDSKGQVRFKGPVDDQFTKGRSKTAATKHHLRDAIDNLVAGTSLDAPTEVPVSGCVISRIDLHAKPQPVTFHKDVLPIFQKRCQSCHRPGDVAPFALFTYKDASDWSAMIAEVVEERRMPPWRVVSKHELKGDEFLTNNEIATITDWVRAGAPEGNRADAPPPIKWPKEARWKIGKPDWEFEFEKPFVVQATGAVEYQYFPIKNPFPDRDRWVTAVETAPGNKRVVHHIQVHVVKRAVGDQKIDPIAMMMLFGFSADNASLIGGYAPGDQFNSRLFPPGYAMRIPAGHDLIMEMHYTPSGEVQQDRSRLAFKFTDKPPQHELKSRFLHHKLGGFNVPAGAMHHRMVTDYWFEKNTKLLGVRPHMHSRGKHFELQLVYPPGRRFEQLSPPVSDEERTEIVLSVPTFDFNWQRSYEFKEPIIVPAGAELRGIAHFDNSRFNPANPDPKVDVPWGQQVYQEMFATKFFFEELSARETAELASRKRATEK
jgi:thiol-disulfide isomerase/thioredoxin